MNSLCVGVVGAGVIGVGVAHSVAEANHRVIVIDVSDEVLKNAEKQIRNDVRLNRLLKKTPKSPGVNEILERLEFTTDYQRLDRADFVIENVPEKWEVKQRVYERLDSICAERCVFAANTSAISITRIGSTTTRPAKVVGMHFMNPVPLKPVVEVIRGHNTSDQTVETAGRLLASMGKTCVVVNDMPGFVSNRVLMLTVNEAIYLIQDRVAEVEDIDKIFKSCFEHKMGPLETADLIGLDTILLSLEVLRESFGDKYLPCPLLMRMVAAGLLGRKSGRGFYLYSERGQG